MRELHKNFEDYSEDTGELRAPEDIMSKNCADIIYEPAFVCGKGFATQIYL